MIIRLRSAPVAGIVALLFVLLIAGLAAANTILNPTIVNKTPTTTSTTTTTTSTTSTTAAAFVDTNGNGVADSCEQNVVADPTKAAAEQAAVDTNDDGTISVPEAAHSDRIGGKNCNHGGYVSSVANAGADEQSETNDNAAPTTECVPVPLPERDPSLDGQKNAHGKWISTVAQSDATGGKNCNHGGAVSDASKADNVARKALRDAARAAAKAARQQGKDESGGE